jgi:hypothetical protein
MRLSSAWCAADAQRVMSWHTAAASAALLVLTITCTAAREREGIVLSLGRALLVGG